MAIRDRVRRALRPSDSSDNSDQSDNNTSSSQTSEQSVLQKSASRLTRTWTWGSNKERDPEKEEQRRAKKSKNKRRPMHPSEKPLTAQNIKTQEMLSEFTWTFGTRRLSQIEDYGFGGISPCCTRPPSVVCVDDADDEISPSISPEGRRSLADAPIEDGGHL